APLADGSADKNFGANGKSDGKDHRPEPFVGIKQHRTRKTRNNGGGKKVQQVHPATGETEFAVSEGSIHPFEQHLQEDGRANADEWSGPGLFKPQISMSQDIPNNHQDREIPERKKPQLRVPARIEQESGVERRSLH